MSDEEIVREALNLIPAVDYRSEDEDAMHDGLAALSRILSDRDSLRAALERVKELAESGGYDDGSMLPDIETVCAQALTSSEKEKG